MAREPLRPELGRTRFYAILDTAYVSRRAWVATCECLVRGGADLIQVRAKRESAAERETLLAEVLPLFDRAGGQVPHLIINDDVDLCARYPGVGLHVGQEDTRPERARDRIGSDRLLGLSTHSYAQAAAAQGLPEGTIDYFCVGPVFATQTKPDYVPVGLNLVADVAATQPKLPWFCIGGINRGNVRQVVNAGASRVVVVSDVLLAEDPAEAVRELRRALFAPSEG